MVSLVRAFVSAKKPERAVAFLQTILKANPQNAEAYALLGTVALSRNDPDEALRNFKTAIEKQPNNVTGYRALAEFYLSRNNNDEALKVIRSGLRVQPESSELRSFLASVLELKGDYDAAIAEYQTLLRSAPNSLIVANNLASLLADHRTDRASLDQAQSVVAILKKSPIPQFKDTLGWVSYLQGDYATAIPLLDQAATALPGQAVIRYHLGMAYLAAGQQDKAAEQLKLALGGNPDHELKSKIEAALRKVGT
jgi:tetratricopeptide (TPR) repeat protein